MKLRNLVERFKKFKNSTVSSPESSRQYSVVYPQDVSPQFNSNNIPETVARPPYYLSGDPGPSPNFIDLKNAEQIEKMRHSCSLARSILNKCGQLVKPGVRTEQIDELVTQLSFDAGAYPSPLNYRKFPKSVCTSVNNCVCHGIPDSRELESGDIVNVDVTVFINGVHGDCSETFLVGQVDKAGQELVAMARNCLHEGIEQCGPGKPFTGIGAAIEEYLQGTQYKVVPAFTGHGIGKYFHGPPDIYHCRNSFPGVMKAGMTFTVEPAISEGTHLLYLLEDGWTAVTRDGSRSAQFEHTVLITDDGVEILTN